MISTDLADAVATLTSGVTYAPECSARLFRRVLLEIARASNPGQAAAEAADFLAECLPPRDVERTVSMAGRYAERPGRVVRAPGK